MAVTDALGIEQALKALERPQRDLAAFGMQLACIMNAAPEARHDLLIEYRPE